MTFNPMLLNAVSCLHKGTLIQ